MSDNVIILGAGFSYDAGIPLLGGVVECMWEYASRRTNNGKALSAEDVAIFESAIKVRNELDGYHGRANFDNRNIEDILSILSFNALSGGKKERDKLTAITSALARMIELRCLVTHPGVSNGKSIAVKEGPEQYRSFWLSLFRWLNNGHSLPTVITFNYDLVLERSLLQLLVNYGYFNSWKNRAPFSSIQLRYCSDQVPDQTFLLKYTDYTGANFETSSGTILTPANGNIPEDVLAIEILKLHGSLNFPEKSIKTSSSDFNLATCADVPCILPPIFNKFSSDKSVEVWKVAMKRLRSAKNIVIVGYSLPRTDIYMQYFLKASLGPNLDLNKITVFDPLLFRDEPSARDMEARYKECFSTQLQRHIVFRPKEKTSSKLMPGSTAHFVHLLANEPESVFF